jgi:uncharacterized protein YnzC (UPF0291/DUF896 family)
MKEIKTISQEPVEREVLRDAMLESLRRKQPNQFETLKTTPQKS